MEARNILRGTQGKGNPASLLGSIRDQNDLDVTELSSCPSAVPVSSELTPAPAGDENRDDGADSGLLVEGKPTSSPSAATPSRHRCSELEELRRLQLQQRQDLSMFSRPLSTVRYFFLSVAGQVSSLRVHKSWSPYICGSLLVVLSAVTLLVALDLISDTLIHECLSYTSFCLWWIVLGILSTIGLGTGLQTFLLYLGPHIAKFTLKATACGRTDMKVAPYDTSVWGVSDTWSSRACKEFGEPTYPHFPGEHGGYYAVPLLHLVLAVLPEAMLWGMGTAIGELPPFLIARAARLSGEHAKALDEIVEGESNATEDAGEEYHVLKRTRSARETPVLPGKASVLGQGAMAHGGPEGDTGGRSSWLETLFRGAKLWLFSQGREFGFLTIVFLAAIPNPLFDLAGLTCGHFLVPAWKFFSATMVGKSLFKAPSQAVVVAMLFNAHSIEMLEDALDSLSQEQIPFLGANGLTWLTGLLDAFKQRMTQGRSLAPRKGTGFSISMLWTGFVVLMFIAFMCSIVTSTARAYLLHQQQQDLLRLQQQLKLKQALQQDRKDGQCIEAHAIKGPAAVGAGGSGGPNPAQ